MNVLYTEEARFVGPLLTIDDFQAGLPLPDLPDIADRRVIIPQSPLATKDMSSAADFGQVIYLFDGWLATSKHIPAIQKLLDDWLEVNFDPARDYIALAGGDPLTGVLLGISLMKNFPDDDIKYLRWRRYRGKDPRTGATVVEENYELAKKVSLDTQADEGEVE